MAGWAVPCCTGESRAEELSALSDESPHHGGKCGPEEQCQTPWLPLHWDNTSHPISGGWASQRDTPNWAKGKVGVPKLCVFLGVSSFFVALFDTHQFSYEHIGSNCLMSCNLIARNKPDMLMIQSWP